MDQQMIQDNINSSSKGNGSFEPKVGSSLDTIATVSPFFRKKVSLTSVISFKSIPDHPIQNNYSLQKKLFIRFLHSKNNIRKKNKYLQEIRSVYENLQSSKFDKKNERIISPFKQSDGSVPQSMLPSISHFAGIWLIQMCYHTEENKKYILRKAKMVLRIEMMSQAVGFYEKFGEGFLSEEDRFKLVIGTCENGWQFFIEKLVQKIRGTLKTQSLS